MGFGTPMTDPRPIRDDPSSQRTAREPLVTPTRLHREMERRRGRLFFPPLLSVERGPEEELHPRCSMGASGVRRSLRSASAGRREKRTTRTTQVTRGARRRTHATAESRGYRHRTSSLTNVGDAFDATRAFSPSFVLRTPSPRSMTGRMAIDEVQDESHWHRVSAGVTPKERGAGHGGLSSPTQRSDFGRNGFGRPVEHGRRASGSERHRGDLAADHRDESRGACSEATMADAK